MPPNKREDLPRLLVEYRLSDVTLNQRKREASMATDKKKKPAHLATKSTGSVVANGIVLKRAKKNTRLDRVVEARYVRTAQMFLRFADGLEGTWSFRQLGLDMSNMKLTSIKASASGDSVNLKSKWNDEVELDTSSLRTLVDPEYAACLEKKINSLLIPSERLERIAAQNQPPQKWYDSSEKPE
jgi:hypothetical protein